MEGKLPKGWEWKDLGSILQIERGGSPRPIDKYITNDENGYNWIKISDATASNKYILKTKEKIKKEGLYKTKLVVEGDFILSNSMSFGRPYIMRTSGCIHDGWLLLRKKNESNLDTEFLYYVLSSQLIFNQFNIKASGTTVRNLNAELVRNVSIPLPPLSEQKKIVALVEETFEKIDRAIALCRENLDHIKKMNGSVLEEVFNLELERKTKLRDATTKIGSGSTPTGGHIAYKKSGISLIRSLNVYDEGFKMKGLAFIDEIQAKKLDNVELFKGDVLLNITGASIARSCIVPENLLPARVNQHVSILRPKNEIIISKYLHYILISPKTKIELLSISGGGATREALNKQLLENFDIPIPSLDKQSQIVAYLDALIEKNTQLTQHYEDRIKSLIELKNSVLEKAFKGEMRKEGVGLTEVLEIQKLASGRTLKSENFNKRLVLGSHIVYNFHHEPEFGHVKFMKLLYLCEQIGEMNILTHIQKAAAGPFDKPALVLIDKTFKKNNWFEIIEKPFIVNSKERKKTIYKLTEKSLEYTKYFDRYFGKERDKIEILFGLFKGLNSRKCEIIATLYYCYKELKNLNYVINDDSIINAFFDFHPEKGKNFKLEDVKVELPFLYNNNLIPKI